jgi:hypothetical protein
MKLKRERIGFDENEQDMFAIFYSGKECHFLFEVKFYPIDPEILKDDITRYVEYTVTVPVSQLNP